MNLIILMSIFINILLVVEGANPSDGITRLKNKINSAVNDLTRYSNSLESNLKYKLSNLKINEMTNVNNAVNSAIDETRNGKLLLSKLDLIMINCASGTPMQVQVCIAQQMPEANSSVNNYESTVSQLKNTGDSISSSGITGTMRCFQMPMTTLYNNVSSARIATSNCIKNA
ncbi:hypothetical protein G9C98_001950 [Cotesia typhae]|uniref:Uncharacterized protein n=1 Tax=Cotesia typhae TaxID=2053667 RepID=A0A8J5R3N6_9HYME|nr:hypothetical protein G9C98_001950 [Cotesia typhae]